MASEYSIDRRAFIRALPAAGLLLAGRRASAHPAIQPVGVQLYTVRGMMRQDPEGTLAQVAQIGYREVEFAGLAGRTAAEMRAILDRLGLRAVSSHHSLADVRDNAAATFDAAATLGQSFVIVSSLPRGNGLDGIRATADAFNAAGEAARARGMRFGFHNHDAEFRPIDGVVPYDLLLERCDPNLVVMQLDIYWIVNAGRDPLEYFAKHPGRFPLVHAKDRTADGQMVNVGAGVIDFRAILARAQQAGIRHWLVEHDRPSDPIADIRASYQYLAALQAG